MNTFIYIIGMLLIGVVCYFLGLKRGITSSQYLYDDGWLAAEEYFKQHPELVQDLDKMMDDLYDEYKRDCNQKYEIARQMVRELDDLFDPECPLPEDDDNILDGEEEDNVIDGGWY